MIDQGLFDQIISYEMGELDWEATVDLFQTLVNSGLAWRLQGSYGRMARDLIDFGLIQTPTLHKNEA